MPNWLFFCKTITFLRYFKCSLFSQSQCKIHLLSLFLFYSYRKVENRERPHLEVSNNHLARLLRGPGFDLLIFCCLLLLLLQYMYVIGIVRMRVMHVCCFKEVPYSVTAFHSLDGMVEVIAYQQKKMITNKQMVHSLFSTDVLFFEKVSKLM